MGQKTYQDYIDQYYNSRFRCATPDLEGIFCSNLFLAADEINKINPLNGISHSSHEIEWYVYQNIKLQAHIASLQTILTTEYNRPVNLHKKVDITTMLPQGSPGTSVLVSGRDLIIDIQRTNPALIGLLQPYLMHHGTNIAKITPKKGLRRTPRIAVNPQENLTAELTMHAEEILREHTFTPKEIIDEEIAGIVYQNINFTPKGNQPRP